VLSIENENLVFSPSAIDRAVGAKQTVIPLSEIKLVDVVGTLTEFLIVKTLNNIYRFVGRNPHKIREQITHALQNVTLRTTTFTISGSESQSIQTSSLNPSTIGGQSTFLKSIEFHGACTVCSQPLRPSYYFCPYCRAVLTLRCPKCKRLIESDWKFCAYCAEKFVN
jgi:RNA polymerase subunit RPABC4/transcription elongation factor Spt4